MSEETCAKCGWSPDFDGHCWCWFSQAPVNPLPELRRQLSAATARASELEKQAALYREGYEARGKILAAHRTGGRPSEKAMNDAFDVAKEIGLLQPETKGT